jgi:hypothetical protein
MAVELAFTGAGATLVGVWLAELTCGRELTGVPTSTDLRHCINDLADAGIRVGLVAVLWIVTGGGVAAIAIFAAELTSRFASSEVLT